MNKQMLYNNLLNPFLRYKWLDRVFPGTTKIVIVKKLVLDQFVLTPYLLSVFYAGKFINLFYEILLFYVFFNILNVFEETLSN